MPHFNRVSWRFLPAIAALLGACGGPKEPGVDRIFVNAAAYTRVEDAPVQPRASERLEIHSLIRGYTIDAVWQLRLANETGSPEAGKRADLVLLDRNLFEIDSYDIHETQVVLTLLDGEAVYNDEL